MAAKPKHISKSHTNLKYELVKCSSNTGYKQLRVRALRDFSDVKAGDVGGVVDSIYNLSQTGNCWIYDDSRAYSNSRVTGNAQLREGSLISDNAKISDDVVVSDNSQIYAQAEISGKVKVTGKSIVGSSAVISGELEITNAVILEHAEVFDKNHYFSANLEYLNSKTRVTVYRTKEEVHVVISTLSMTLTQFEVRYRDLYNRIKHRISKNIKVR